MLPPPGENIWGCFHGNPEPHLQDAFISASPPAHCRSPPTSPGNLRPRLQPHCLSLQARVKVAFSRGTSLLLSNQHRPALRPGLV